MNLEEHRKNIDEIDKQLIILIQKRFQIVKEIAFYKKENNLKIFNQNRELEIISKKQELGKQYNIDEEFIKNFFEVIFTESREIQNKLII